MTNPQPVEIQEPIRVEGQTGEDIVLMLKQVLMQLQQMNQYLSIVVDIELEEENLA